MMTVRHTLAALLLSLFSMGTVYAAGSAINEDLSQLISITDELVKLGKQGDAEGFINLAKAGMDITSVNRNNSSILSRVGSKFNAAKRAVKKGDFNTGIEVMQEAKALLLDKREPTWDGGS